MVFSVVASSSDDSRQLSCVGLVQLDIIKMRYSHTIGSGIVIVQTFRKIKGTLVLKHYLSSLDV